MRKKSPQATYGRKSLKDIHSTALQSDAASPALLQNSHSNDRLLTTKAFLACIADDFLMPTLRLRQTVFQAIKKDDWTRLELSSR